MRPEFKALRSLAPHLEQHRGKLFVLKIGGEILAAPQSTARLIEQLRLLQLLGIRLLLVHGGGPQISAACTTLGLEPQLVQGRRVTTPKVLEVASMVLAGSLQSTLLAALQGAGLKAAGLSGASAGLLLARRRPPVPQPDGTALDYGEVGDLISVDAALLQGLLAQGCIPVVAPLGCSAAGELLNINADTVSAAVASAVQAEKLIFLMGLPGILRDSTDPGSLISELNASELTALGAQGRLIGGMLPKAAATLLALAQGLQRVHFVSAVAEDALLIELFTNEGSGTMVLPDA